MTHLELSPERVELLRQTVEEALGIAEDVLEDAMEDRMPDTPEDQLALFVVQRERVDDLRDLLQELRGA